MDYIATDNNSIIVISKTEGFLVKGIEQKLKENGLNNAFSTLDVKPLASVNEYAKLYILNLNDVTDEDRESIIYLKDSASEKDRQIILVGEPLEIEWAADIIPPIQILDTFIRPFDMDKLIKVVSKYMDRVDSEETKKSILIVDDDITYMRTVYGWLKNKYRVGMASSGIQAISWLAKNKADLILLDYQMPVADGPQILSMLKSDTTTEDVPVMFLTGQDDRDSVMAVMDLKPVDYLLKTIDKATLNKKIDDYFMRLKIEQLTK